MFAKKIVNEPGVTTSGRISVSNLISTFQSSFSPLKIRNFRLYLGGQAISLVGTWMQAAAMGWLVWQLSGSNTALGIVVALNTLPFLLLGPLAGVWADRLDRRRLIIASQSIAMALAFSLALLTQTGLVQLWHIYVLSAVLGIVNAFDMPAQQAFVGDLSGLAEVRKAVTVNAIILQMSRMVGPALAGVLIGDFGASVAFWLNGASFLFVIGSLLVIRSNQQRASSQHSTGGDFGAALGFLRSQPRIQDLISFAALLAFFGLSVFNVLPSMVTDVLHGKSELYGLLMGMSGAGALFGALVVVPLAQSLRKTGLVVAGAIVWSSLWWVLFSLSTVVPLSMLAIFLISLAAPVVLTTALGVMQLLAPPTMRARLVSLFLMVSLGTQPVGALFIGFSADHLGVATAIRMNGLLLLLGGGLILVARSHLRQWEARSQPLVEATHAA